MRRSLPIRILLIVLIAIFSGPRPGIAATGEWVVICGDDGAPRAILFDFETGAPTQPDETAEACAQCLACDTIALTQPSPVATGVFTASDLTPAPQTTRARSPASTPRARAPPFPV